MSDDAFDAPPRVVVDENGIGAWIDGVLSYSVHWAQIETVEVVVVGHGFGAEAYWAIDGSPPGKSPAFVAPVELIVGGDVLTSRLRSLPGFDEFAFRQAKAAEEHGVEGTYLCWRRS